MKFIALLIGFFSTLTFGIWAGIGIGVEIEFKREAAFQGLLLTEYHAALVDNGSNNEQTLCAILDQAENITTIARSEFSFESLNLINLFSRETRERYSGMRDQTSLYLKSVEDGSNVTAANL